ncbi:MAG: hypothetical protein Q8K64_14290 [Sediminibacterium sp.]|nr:hypothetical protein [Sediminibacterium sp.]
MKKKLFIFLGFIFFSHFVYSQNENINKKSSFKLGLTVPLGLNLSASFETYVLKQKRLSLIPAFNLMVISGFQDRNIPYNTNKTTLTSMLTLEGRYYFILQKKMFEKNGIPTFKPGYYFAVKEFLINDPIIKGNQYSVNYGRGNATAALVGTQLTGSKYYFAAFIGFVFKPNNTEIPIPQIGATIGLVF